MKWRHPEAGVSRHFAMSWLGGKKAFGQTVHCPPIYRTPLPMSYINYLTAIGHIWYLTIEPISLVPRSPTKRLWLAARTRRAAGEGRALLRIAKYGENYERSAGILPAVAEASRSLQRAGRMPTPQRARRPRYENNWSLYFAILCSVARVQPAAPPRTLRKGRAFPQSSEGSL